MIPINTYSSVDPTRTSNVLNQIPPGTIQQARQGKAGAILQVLNRLLAELKLADLEVKARAVLREGVLYVLCEAPTARSLDQSTIVSTVCRGLTILQPDHVATARIYGRVEQAEQLLWLDQLDSDLHPPLLWQEEIPLQQPNLFQRFLAGLMAHSRGKVTSASRDQTMIFDSIQVPPSRNRFRYGFLMGAILSLLMGGIAIALAFKFRPQVPLSSGSPAEFPTSLQTPSSGSDQNSAPSPIPDRSSPTNPDVSLTFVPEVPQLSDEAKFAQAVRLAEEAVNLGKSAQTRAEWLVIAEKWQAASVLMATVSSDYSRYGTAQNRGALYRRNAEVAQDEADRRY